MKKLVLVVLLAVVFSASARLEAAYTKAVATDPVNLLQNDLFNITYETLVSSNNSFLFGFTLDNNYENVVGYTFEANYRWYLRDVFPVATSGLKGLSVGPYGILGLYSWDNPVNHETSNDFYFAVGGSIEYKWIWGGFQVEPILSVGIPLVKESYAKKFRWGLGVSLGYAW